MAKNNFLLVDLNEDKTKKLAETITSDTSRKILNLLVEKEDSEANIAKELQIPISTIHYHLQKLQEAGLVIVEEFHYSKKGREINHYKLANKYIIIAPKKISGLKEKLKGILPVGIISLGIAVIIQLIQSFSSRVSGFESGKVLAKTTEMISYDMVQEAMPPASVNDIHRTLVGRIIDEPNIALWFLIGSLSAIVIYLFVMIIKEWRGKK